LSFDRNHFMPKSHLCAERPTHSGRLIVTLLHGKYRRAASTAVHWRVAGIHKLCDFRNVN
jgi:hypothetical protein